MKIKKTILFNALATGGAITALGLAIVNAIQREDGSNVRYNVTGYKFNGQQTTLFVQTTN